MKTVYFDVGNVWTKVRGPTEAHSVLHEEMSVHQPHAWYTQQYRLGLWDGKVRLYNLRYNSFLSGFVKQAEEHLRTKFKVEIIDSTTDYHNEKALQGNLDRVLEKTYANEKGEPHPLRWYQIKAITEAVKNRRGVVKCPTGSGKTIIALGICETFAQKSLVIVNKKDLLYQTRDFFASNSNAKIGILGASERTDGEYVIATIQTLTSLLKRTPKELKSFLGKFSLVIGDEVHHTSDNYYYKTISSCINAPYRIGLSATPLKRRDVGDLFLIGTFGEIIYEVTADELSKQGYLAKPLIQFHMIEKPDLSSIGNYHVAYQRGIIENEHRNEIVIQKAIEFSKRKIPSLILVRQVVHGTILQQMFQQNGFDVPFLFGQSSIDIRRDAVKTFDEKSILIASTIWDEGVNIPNIRAMIIAASGASEIKILQRIGRGMRPKKNVANEVLIVDFVDKTNKYLLKHSRQRIETLLREKYVVDVMQNDILKERFSHDAKKKTQKKNKERLVRDEVRTRKIRINRS
jgi:superfamily II DNA or RNA helicase